MSKALLYVHTCSEGYICANQSLKTRGSCLQVECNIPQNIIMIYMGIKSPTWAALIDKMWRAVLRGTEPHNGWVDWSNVKFLVCNNIKVAWTIHA